MKKLLLISLVSLLLITCKKNVTGSSDKGVIMPLTIGNSWIYDNGNEITINSKIDIDGDTWYIDNSDDYYRNDSEGLWFYDFDDAKEGLFIKYPIDINESFINYDGMRFTCTSTDITFVSYIDCYEYYYSELEDGALFEITFYCKPNIGIVGILIRASYSGESFEDLMVLESYTLN